MTRVKPIKSLPLQRQAESLARKVLIFTSVINDTTEYNLKLRVKECIGNLSLLMEEYYLSYKDKFSMHTLLKIQMLFDELRDYLFIIHTKRMANSKELINELNSISSEFNFQGMN